MGFTLTGKSAIKRVLSNCVYAGLIKIPTSKVPVRYVKAIHQPIVSEPDYWLAQEMLGNKPSHPSQPAETMPLRGILKCSCGSSMTAGWSKGRKKSYLYYRCIKHPGINVPGQKLHEAFEQIVNIFSFKEQVDYVAQKAVEILKERLIEYSKLLQFRNQELANIERKVENLEDKMINDEIDRDIYDKWHNIYTERKHLVLEDVEDIEKDKEHVMQKMQEQSPRLLNIAALYQEVDHTQRQQLIKGIFKYGISYSENAFRTPHINPVFNHVLNEIKDSGLLVVEPPSQVWEQNYICV